MILATAFPVLNHEAQVLRRYGKVGRYIRKLDREMDSKLKMHQDNVIVTENFLIVSYLSHIDVVRIDDIKYLSKHVEKRRRRMGRPITVYRFTASNGEDLYFEADFFDEGVINDVIYYMRGEPLLEYEEMSEQERAQEEAMMQDAIAEERSREAEAVLESYEQMSEDDFAEAFGLENIDISDFERIDILGGQQAAAASFCMGRNRSYDCGKYSHDSSSAGTFLRRPGQLSLPAADSGRGRTALERCFRRQAGFCRAGRAG